MRGLTLYRWLLLAAGVIVFVSGCDETKYGGSVKVHTVSGEVSMVSVKLPRMTNEMVFRKRSELDKLIKELDELTKQLRDARERMPQPRDRSD